MKIEIALAASVEKLDSNFSVRKEFLDTLKTPDQVKKAREAVKTLLDRALTKNDKELKSINKKINTVISKGASQKEVDALDDKREQLWDEYKKLRSARERARNRFRIKALSIPKV